MAARDVSVGGGAGVVLAGTIVDNFSYHYLFWLPLIQIIAATILTHLVVPRRTTGVLRRVS